MSDDIKVVVYGASGYTGECIMWKLAERNIPFIAAGRNKEKLAKKIASIPELKGARYEIQQCDHNEEALRKLLKGKVAIYNLVGPFAQLGEPVIKAALAEGVHYLDAAGEQDWMIKVREEYGKAFADKGIVISSAVSNMWTAGMLVAEDVLSKPGVDSIEIIYYANAVPSEASTLSFVRMCCQTQYRKVLNKLEAWPPAYFAKVALPGVSKVLTAMPWSGGGESVFYENDPRVLNCSTLVAFDNQALMDLLIPFMEDYAANYAHKSFEEREAFSNSWADQIKPPVEPAREDVLINRSVLVCNGRGTMVGRSTVTYGATGYIFTGVLAASCIETFLAKKQKVSGFASAIDIAGNKQLRTDLYNAGLMGETKEVIS